METETNKDSVEEPKTTRKVPAITTMDEKEYVQFQYDLARTKMLKDPSQENIDAFTRANATYFETMDAYRIGAKLLAERIRNLRLAFGEVFGKWRF